VKRLLTFLWLFPMTVLAQSGTQHDRIIVRGPIRNDQIIVITGTTPSVGLGNVFKTNNSSSTTISNFIGGAASQQIWIVCGDNNTSIANNSTIVISSGANISCSINSVFSFIFDAVQSKWVQSGTGSGGGGGGGGGGSGIIYNTPVTASHASLGPTQMLSSSTQTGYLFTVYVDQFDSGVTCTTPGQVSVNLIYTDDATGTSYTQTLQLQAGPLLTTSLPLTTGAITTLNSASSAYQFSPRLGTAISYSTTYTPGSCVTGQNYSIYPVLTNGVGGGGGGGGSTSPGVPSSSLQYNNAGTFTGTTFLFNVGANSITAAGGAPKFILQSTGSNPIVGGPANLVSLQAPESNVGCGGLGCAAFASTATNPNKVAFGIAATGIIVGNSGTGNCQAGAPGGTADCAVGGYYSAQDSPTDTVNGQDLVGASSVLGMNKVATHNIGTGVGFRTYGPVNSLGLPITETASNIYGFEIMDQGGLSTTQQAAIKIHAQTTPAGGAKYGIKCDSGCGRSSFADGLDVPFGTLTTDKNPFSLTFTLNNAAQVFNGVQWVATNSAYAAGSFDYQFCGDAHCMTIDPAGNLSVPKTLASGDSTVAGNIEFQQGPIPGILPNNVGFAAPTSVPSGGHVIILPASPCTGNLTLTAAGQYSTMACNGVTSISKRETAKTVAVTSTQLCAVASCGAGEYEVHVHANSTAVCATPGPAAIAFSVNFTTDTIGAMASVPVQIDVWNGSAATRATSMPLGDTATISSGGLRFWSTGAADIQLNVTYTACTSGTGTYSYSAEVQRLQ
jgi:hypothetical protein